MPEQFASGRIVALDSVQSTNQKLFPAGELCDYGSTEVCFLLSILPPDNLSGLPIQCDKKTATSIVADDDNQFFVNHWRRSVTFVVAERSNGLPPELLSLQVQR